MANNKALTAAKDKLKEAKTAADKNAVWMFRATNGANDILAKKYSPNLWMTNVDGGFIHNALEKPNSFVQGGLNTLYEKGTPNAEGGIIYKTETNYPWRGENGGNYFSADKKGKNTLKGAYLSFEQPSNVEAFSAENVRTNGGGSIDAKKMATPSDAKKIAGAKLNLADVKKRSRKTTNLVKKIVKAIF